MGKRKTENKDKQEKIKSVNKNVKKKSVSNADKKSSVKQHSEVKSHEPRKSTKKEVKNAEKQHPQKKTKGKNQAKKQKVKISYLEKYNLSKLLTNDEGKNNQLKELIRAVESLIHYEFLIPSKSKILLAVSGGVDSIVMLDILFQLAAVHKYELIVCHFNHKLRGISADKDEKFVKRIAKQYGLKFISDSGDVQSYAKEYSKSIEQAARILRYGFFERVANIHHIPYVMLAHTADDTAETVLLNLLRGSGLTGLAGIPMQRSLGRKSQVVRPLIKLRKSDLIAYAKLRKLKWHEDETNSLLNFTRNKIRHDLIKKLEAEYNPQIVDTLNRTAYLVRLADEFVKEHLASYLNNFKWSKKKGLLSINITLFESCGTYIQGEMLKAKLKDKFNLSDLSQTMLERIIQLPKLEVGSIIEIGKDIVALRDRDFLHFYRERKENYFEIDVLKQGVFDAGMFDIKLSKVSRKNVKIKEKKNVEYLDFDLVPAVLKLRSWLPGDFFQPLGMTGSMKISDFLINEKVSLFDKNNVLVLSSKNDIICVCGYRINDKYKVTSSTTRFLKIELIKKENGNGEE